MNGQKQTQVQDNIANSIALRILDSDFKFPPMPANGSKLMALVQKPVNDIDISSFIQLIETDPGLFSMVLQLANSIYFRGQDEIFTLRAAIIRVGIQETINTVNLYFFQRVLPKIPEIAGFSTENYWAFSWACATAARRLGHPNLNMNALAGELYLGGLLHGIGKLILAIHHPAEFSKCVRKACELGCSLHKVELDQFGTTDALVASKLMTIWNIPYRICMGVEFHQEPDSAPDEYRDIAALIQFAYYIAGVSGIGTNGDGTFMALESTWLARQTGLPLSKKKIQERVVKDILISLDKKSKSVLGIMPQTKESSSDQKTAAEKNQTVPEKVSFPLKKKGVLGWLKSLFS